MWSWLSFIFKKGKLHTLPVKQNLTVNAEIRGYLKFLHKTKTKDVEDETAIFDFR